VIYYIRRSIIISTDHYFNRNYRTIKSLFRKFLPAGLELGGEVRYQHDNDGMALPYVLRLEAGRAINDVIEHHSLSGATRELAYELIQFAYSEGHTYSGERPESFDAVEAALQ